MYNLIRLRILEWIGSFNLFLLGITAFINPNILQASGLHLFSDSGLIWAILLMVIGSSRILALVVNGNWNGGTPVIRMLGAAIGAASYGAIAGSFLSGSVFGPFNWGFVVFFMFTASEVINAYYSTSDVAKVKKYEHILE